MTTAITLPDQPDGVDQFDPDSLPDPARAAGRVGQYIAAFGDGMLDQIGGTPLYARDLEAMRRTVEAAAYVFGARECVEGECDHAAEVDEDAPEDAPCPLVARYATADDLLAAQNEAEKLRAEVDRLRAEQLTNDERQRAANGIKAYIRLCGDRITDDHPLHAIAAKLSTPVQAVAR